MKLSISVQRNFFSAPEYSGTVKVNGDEYTDNTKNATLSASPSPSFVSRNHSFNFICNEWQGSELTTRLVAFVEDGSISTLTLQDADGNPAEEYCK